MARTWIGRRWKLLRGRVRARGRRKVFGVGFHKTGTTSLKRAFGELGLVVGDQRTAETFLEDWAVRDFRRVVRYCRTAQAFQDTPFGLPYTFQAVDAAFPGSRFVLTVRESDAWYDSLTRFQGKLWAGGRVPPTAEDLRAATYRTPGRPWRSNRWIYDSPDDDPYERGALIRVHERHEETVREYFRHRPDDLLVLDVAEADAYARLGAFLGVTPPRADFPWANRTAGRE